MENGNKSISGRREVYAKALWQKSHGGCGMKKASGTQVEKAKKGKERIGWPHRSLQALLRGFAFLLRARGEHLMVFEQRKIVIRVELQEVYPDYSWVDINK